MARSDISMSPVGRGRSRSRSKSRSVSVPRGQEGTASRTRSRSRSGDRDGSPRVRLGPALVRCFIKAAPGFHPIEDFEDKLLPLKDEYAVYASLSDSLMHVLSLLYLHLPTNFRVLNAKYNIRLVYFDGAAAASRDARRVWRHKDVGTVTARDLLRTSGEDPSSKTLKDIRWQPGDYICISVYTPTLAGPLGPAPIAAGPGARPLDGPRNRDFGWSGPPRGSGAFDAPRADLFARPGPAGDPSEGSWTKAREETAAMPNQGLPPALSIRGRGGHRGGLGRADREGFSGRGGRERSRSPDYTQGGR